MSATPEPPIDCAQCPRLVDFRIRNRGKFPDWHNGPVSSFGPAHARLLIVGLAPGLKGANRTGRPFTGDYAGDVLYPALLRFGFARGTYRADPSDGLELVDCMITNAVRCVPPENKPTPAEIKTCRSYLTFRLGALPRLEAVLALGRIAHDSFLSTMKFPLARHPFAHGRVHTLGPRLRLFDSYHCSRYNINTRVLTEEMFSSVLEAVRTELG